MATVSLGSFANASEAREEMTRLLSKDSWQCNVSKINAYGIGLFQRDVTDGKFYLVTSVPLVEPNYIKTILNDMGDSASTSMSGISSLILKEIERACQYVTSNMGHDIEIILHTYGSHAIGTSLPGISDIDAVIDLKSSLPSADIVLKSQNNDSFLKKVASRLSFLHKNSRIRIRVSNAGDRPLYILTVKLAHQYPSMDLMVCKYDSVDKIIDKDDNDAMNVIKDSEAILSSIHSYQHMTSMNTNQAICGALRVIKLWAFQRQVYGTRTGFLGGGAWAILLLWLLRKRSKEELSILFSGDTVASVSRNIVLYFFQNIYSNWENENVVTLTGYDINELTVIEQARELVSIRSSMAVIAPISGGNFGRSSTRSTTLTTKAELLRVKQLLDGKTDFDDSLLEKYQMYSGLLLILEVEILSGSHVPRPSEVKALGATLILRLIVALEKVIDPNIIRPTTHVVRKRASFVFLIGVQDSSTITLSLMTSFIAQQSRMVKDEVNALMTDAEVSLSSSTVEDYKDHPQ